MMSAKEFIEQLQLQPHPEGGYYRRTYTATEQCMLSKHFAEQTGQQRAVSSAIYYLLEAGQCSHLHRLRSDEMWHFYMGDSLQLYQFAESGYQIQRLGLNLLRDEQPQYCVPAGTWMAAEHTENQVGFSLVGCTVAPAFDFSDFEMACWDNVVKDYPEHEELLQRLCLR